MIRTPEQTTRAVSDAITSALLYVAQTARERVDDGTNLYHAAKHAKACGATHPQITAAMRGGE
jgi:hypothetical protein